MDGSEQVTGVRLFNIPFIGSMNSVGDKIIIQYDKSNPIITKTTFSLYFFKYGIYLLVFFGIIVSIKRIKRMKNYTKMLI